MLKRLVFALGLFFAMASPAMAKVKVVGAYPYIEDLVKQVAGNEVDVQSLATGQWDPHFIVAKPSLVSKLRRADLLIINGAQLEVGWLPPLLRQCNNPRIQPGNSKGFLELANYITKIQVPQNVSRALGDVHPQGNPHFVLNPDNVPKMSDAITQKLCQVDSAHCSHFQQNNAKFKQRWSQSSRHWSQRMGKLKGTRVVEYHRLFDYFLEHYGLNMVDTLEPLPGIPPTPQHLAKILSEVKGQNVTLNIRGAYNPEEPSKFVSSHTNAKMVTLPHDVGAVSGANDIFGIFETILKRLGV